MLTMAESSLAHSIYCEQATIDAQSRNSFTGLICGFVIGLSLVGGAVFCAAIGEKEIALALVGTSALGLVPAFINAWVKAEAKRLPPDRVQGKNKPGK